MLGKILILALFFYFLVLLQTSFLVHFRIFGFALNFVFIAVVLINIFEKPQKYSGMAAAFIGGLFLDIFSAGVIGFNVLILVVLAFLLKTFFKKYVRLSIC
ncbi:MAG: rod shape-determining protein MreD [Candidatus Nealsonbacteria bacterium]|nr:rod shape-determining protein MreD [Candidatus Nealsonbacteria bacterium]